MAHTVTFADLVDWVEDRLPAPEANRISVVVEADSALRETVGWIQEFHCLTGDVVLAGPPPPLRQKLETLFDRHHAGEGTASPRAIMRAELTAEEREDGEWRFTYTIPVAEVTLVVRQRSQERRFDLHGAILTEDDGPALFAVELQRAGQPPALKASDEWGEFIFTRLPAGAYQLTFSGAEVELVIEELRMGPA